MQGGQRAPHAVFVVFVEYTAGLIHVGLLDSIEDLEVSAEGVGYRALRGELPPEDDLQGAFDLGVEAPQEFALREDDEVLWNEKFSWW
jgi:hypothetical protein